MPYTRGPEFSRSFNELINEAKQLVENGSKEITLLGQNVNAYEFKEQANTFRLSDLIFKLNEFKELYSGQKFIDDSFTNYQLLVKKFMNYGSDTTNSIFLIDPYGFLMMQYPQGTEPKGIIKDIEKLIKNSK